MNDKTVTKKPSATQLATKAPAGTYMEDAEAALSKIGVTFVNHDVSVWLSQQQAAGVAIGDLASKWNAPENAVLARETKYVSGLLYLTEELQSIITRQNEVRDALALKLEAEGVTKIAETAADSAEILIATTAKIRASVRFLKALENRMATDQPPEEIFHDVSLHAYRELAQQASNISSRSTSWQENEKRLAQVVALGDVVSLFTDVSRI